MPQLNAEVPTTETESFCALVQILPGDVAEDVGKNTRDHGYFAPRWVSIAIVVDGRRPCFNFLSSVQIHIHAVIEMHRWRLFNQFRVQFQYASTHYCFEGLWVFPCKNLKVLHGVQIAVVGEKGQE